MNTPVYDFGDRLRITGSWSNAAGIATAPDTIRFRVRAPDKTESGAITTTGGIYTVEAGSTGVQSLIFTPPAPGTWVVRGEGLGAVEQAFELVFVVKAPRVTSASIAP